MGVGMASHLLTAGHQLSVYNRSQKKADGLVAEGARRGKTPRDACEGAEIVFSMVSDDDASRDVWLGEEGVFKADLAPGCICVECSTLSYDWVIELASKAQESGLRYIDAPVTGLPEGAERGDLTLLVGGNASDIEAAAPFFDPVSARVIHFGPVGAGTVYKLIINMIGAVQIASVAEGMAIAERAGLDLNVFADALAGGQAASPQAIRNAGFIAGDTHDRTVLFTPPLRLKDVSYALQLARNLGLGAPYGAVAERQFRGLVERGFENSNESKVIEIARLEQADQTL